MQLRDYQQQAVNDIEAGFEAGHGRQLLMLPTGSGKTRTATQLVINRVRKYRRTLFIVDRTELVYQAAQHLQEQALHVGIIQGRNTAYNPSDEVVVATVQSLRSRPCPFAPDLIVIDECHLLHDSHLCVLDDYPDADVIGLSATPLRTGLGDIFSNLVSGPSIKQLVSDGYLAPVKCYGPATVAVDEALQDVSVQHGDFASRALADAMKRRELIGDIVSTWQDRAAGLPTLVFATNIEHSKLIAEQFNQAGIPAAHLSGRTGFDTREQIVQDFRTGALTVLCSVNVLGIGFDAPNAACAVLARPTLSRSLYMQQIGRVMRTAPGKDHGLVLDHAGNVARFGLPDTFRLGSLNEDELEANRAVKRRQDAVMKPCQACGYMMNVKRNVCQSCLHDSTVHKPVINHDGELALIRPRHKPRPRPDTHPMASCNAEERRQLMRELNFIAGDRKYKDGWSAMAFKDATGDYPDKDWSSKDVSPPTDSTVAYVDQRNRLYKHHKDREAKEPGQN